MVCCSMLQCVAVWCSALQLLEFALNNEPWGQVCCVAVCCSMVQCDAACCSLMLFVAACFNVLQRISTFHSVVQCIAVRCKCSSSR